MEIIKLYIKLFLNYTELIIIENYLLLEKKREIECVYTYTL